MKTALRLFIIIALLPACRSSRSRGNNGDEAMDGSTAAADASTDEEVDASTSNGRDAGTSSGRDAAVRDGSTSGCGELPEGYYRCDGDDVIEQCVDGALVVNTRCPDGTRCDIDDEGIACFCDDLADGVCANASICTSDPDCGPIGGTCSPACGSDTTCVLDHCASTDGIDTSVSDCNGAGRLLSSGSIDETMRAVTVYATDAVSGTGYKIFAYTRDLISRAAFPATGTSGEQQLKIAISSATAPVAGGEYAAIATVSDWNGSSWSTSISIEPAIVTLTGYAIDETAWGDGSYCAGYLAGRMEGLVSGTGSELITFSFFTPILTPSFPR